MKDFKNILERLQNVKEIIQERGDVQDFGISLGDKIDSLSSGELKNLMRQLGNPKLPSNPQIKKAFTPRGRAAASGAKGIVSQTDFIKKTLGMPQDNIIDLKDLQLQHDESQLKRAGKNVLKNQLRLQILFNIALDADHNKNTDAQAYLNSFAKPLNLGVFQAIPNWNEVVAVGKKEDDDDVSQWAKSFVEAVDPEQVPDTVDQKIYSRQSLTDPTMVSAAAARGEILESKFAIFNSFLAGTTSMTERFRKITEFSQFVAGEGVSGFKEKYAKNATDYITNVMILEEFNTIAKELDEGSGAYFFELFLAYLAGGKVGGKESGIAGGMGEVDFFTADGSAGSAKFLQKGGEVTQNIASFKVGRSVEYVVAWKKGAVEKRVAPAESDPDKIYNMDIYVFNVERLENRGSKSVFRISSGDGTSKDVLFGLTGKAKFHSNMGSPVGNLVLISVDGKPFLQNLDDIAEELESPVKEAFDIFVELMKSVVTAKDKIKIYSSNAKQEDGKAALKALNSAKEKQQELMTNFQDAGIEGLGGLETPGQAPPVDYSPETEKEKKRRRPEITNTQLEEIIREELEIVLNEIIN